MLIEHHRPETAPATPTARPSRAATRRPTRRSATRPQIYVEYDDGEREYYDLRRDPAERRNVYASLSAREKAKLSALLARLQGCKGAASCWKAAT